MLRHQAGGRFLIAVLQSIQDGKVLAAPCGQAPAVGVAAVFSEAAQAILVLYGLTEKCVPRGVRQTFVEQCIDLEQAAGAAIAGARVKQILVGLAQALQDIGPEPEALLAKARRLDGKTKAVAGLDRFGRIQDRLKDPALSPASPDQTFREHPGKHLEQKRAANGVAAQQGRFDAYARQQADGLWRRLPQRDAQDVRVGIMGSGVLGARAAEVLSRHGFRVAVWSRTPKEQPGIESFAGPEDLAPFLKRSDHLVCLLPLTDATHGLLDAHTLGRLPKGAHVVNCARGAHVVDSDLLRLLDEDHLAAATLDVFVEEPLPPGHPFWGHPKLFVTPHVSSITEPATAVAQIAENLERLERGAPLINLIDRAAGY